MLALSVLVFGGANLSFADNNKNDEKSKEKHSENYKLEKKIKGPKDHENEARSVGSTLEIHITSGGKALVRGAKVTAISGNIITATTEWGSANMTWLVNSSTTTKHVRRYGGSSNISEIEIGDFISFQGIIATGTASPFTVNATIIKDWSVQKKNSKFEGTVSSISGTNFVLATNKNGNITVNTDSSTSIIVKTDAQNNSFVGTFANITLNAKVEASGLFNNQTNVLQASKVTVKNNSAPNALTIGVIKSIAGTTVPTTFVFTSGGTDYTAKVFATTGIITNTNTTTSLTNFLVGQNVQVYGIVNADKSIDSMLIKNTNI